MSSRKSFLKKISLLFSGTLLGQKAKASEDHKDISTLKSEDAAKIFDNTIKKAFDLVVVGGGISGVCAAISAARNSVKVALVHNRAMFGGNSSSEVKLYPENTPGMNPWIKEGGILHEIILEERKRNQDYYREGIMNSKWDLVLYEWVLQEENITSYLNTHMIRPIMANDSTIESVYCIQLGMNRDCLLSAPLFVDATGDGNLGYFSGADCKWGRESKDVFNEPLAPQKPDELLMGNTLFFKARDTGKPVPFKRPDWAAEFESDADIYNGHNYSGPNDTDVAGGYWWIEIGAPYNPIKDMNKTVHEALRQLLGVWDYIKNKGNHGAENYGLEFTGAWPYKRESRRIRGDYILTEFDVQDPKPHKDSVAYGTWLIDIHNRKGILGDRKDPGKITTNYADYQTVGAMVYGIPLRSLYSKDINNLFMAGRPISCSYLGFASSRVLPTGAICGQAVGVAASLAKKYHKLPREIAKKHAEECQQIILKEDGHIPGVVNEDPNDLARKATVKASSESPLTFPDAEYERELTIPHAQLFPVSNKKIDSVKLFLRSERNRAARIQLGLRAAPSVWDFRSEKDLAGVSATIPAGFEGWVTFELDVTVNPNHLYYIYVKRQKGIFWKLFRNNLDSNGTHSKIPIGSAAAVQPLKQPRSEQTKTVQEIFPPVNLADLPGTGKNGRWKPLSGEQSLSMEITPTSYPYGAHNMNQGANRPDQWSNVWVSNPTDSFPVYVNFKWKYKQRFNAIQITFDTNQNSRVTRPLYRYPECIKEYVLECKSGSGWEEITHIKNNYMRRRVHHFDQVRTDQLRLQVIATNGAPEARIYEMRVYNES
jgi:hypothetical protein